MAEDPLNTNPGEDKPADPQAEDTSKPVTDPSTVPATEQPVSSSTTPPATDAVPVTAQPIITSSATPPPAEPPLSEEQIAKNKAVVDEIRTLCNDWRNMRNLFNWGVGILGVLTIGSSAFISIFTDTTVISAAVLKYVAYSSTVSLMLLTGFNLIGYSNNSSKAWRSINVALMRYDANIYNIKELITAYQIGEDTMGTVTFTYAGVSEQKSATTQTRTTQQENVAD